MKAYFAEEVFTERMCEEAATTGLVDEGALKDLAALRSMAVIGEDGSVSVAKRDPGMFAGATSLSPEGDGGTLWGAAACGALCRQAGVPAEKARGLGSAEIPPEAWDACSCRQWDEICGRLVRAETRSGCVRLFETAAPHCPEGVLASYAQLVAAVDFLERGRSGSHEDRPGEACLEDIGYSLSGGWLPGGGGTPGKPCSCLRKREKRHKNEEMG